MAQFGNRAPIVQTLGSPRNTIVITADPHGKFIEWYLDSQLTAYPGMCVSLDPSTTYYKLFDGTSKEVIVLREDFGQGKTVFDAYGNSGTATPGPRFFAYRPLPGDELNLLIKYTGGNSGYAIGSQFWPDSATGKWVTATGTATALAESMETTPTLTADTLVRCRIL